jgi:shikimate kinase
MIVYLIGMTGVGKSTIGKRLAQALQCFFIDLDALIELRSSKRIAELFSEGEDVFRHVETESLFSIKHDQHVVVATGGGVVTREDNIAYMRSTGTVILLTRKIEDIASSFNTSKRPLFKGGIKQLETVYHERKQLYTQAAHMIVDCSDMESAIITMREELLIDENSRH